jgi:hypothetical protein
MFKFVYKADVNRIIVFQCLNFPVTLLTTPKTTRRYLKALEPRIKTTLWTNFGSREQEPDIFENSYS